MGEIRSGEKWKEDAGGESDGDAVDDKTGWTWSQFVVHFWSDQHLEHKWGSILGEKLQMIKKNSDNFEKL